MVHFISEIAYWCLLKKLGTTCNMGLEFLASWTVITTILSDWIFHKLKLHVLIKRTVFLKNTLSIFYLHAQVIFLKEEGVWWTDVWESFRSFTFWFKKMKLSELPEPSYPLHEQVNTISIILNNVIWKISNYALAFKLIYFKSLY